MSASGVNKSVKRTFDFATSDISDNDDGVPPLKIRRHNARSFANKLDRLWNWISELPVKSYFVRIVKMGTQDVVSPITISDEEDEDEDEVTIVEVRKVDGNGKSKEKRHNPFTHRLKNPDKYTRNASSRHSGAYGTPHLRSCKSYSFTSCPISSSTPYTFPDKRLSSKEYISHDCPSDSSVYHAPINGSGAMDWEGNHNVKRSAFLAPRRSSRLKCSAQITNPNTDIEILLDTKGQAQEPEEIEILSVSPVKKVITRSQKTSQLSTSKLCSGLKEISINSQDNATNIEQSPLAEKADVSRKSLNKPSTAVELMRLQEKAEYSRLLQKYVQGPLYHSFIKEESRDATMRNNEVQTDLNDEPIMLNHFKKEVLQQPLDKFLQKYYRPCRLVTPIKTDDDSKVESEKAKNDEDKNKDDDEIQIVDIKLPKYRPRYRVDPDLNFHKPEWLSELQMVVHAETEERLRIVAEHERKVEEYRKKRAAQHAEEMRSRDNLKLTGGIVLDKKVDEEVEYPRLTPEMVAAIDNALNPLLPSLEKLCSLNGLAIHRKDMETLIGLNWLNDEVINYYIALIVERSKREDMPSVHAFNSFFYPSLKTKGYSAVRRWTRKVDIFAFDIILVPLHLAVHWCLAVIDNRSKTIRYYDSMGNGEDQCLELIREYLIDEMKDKKHEVMDPSSYTTETVKDIPQQMNGSDCGMFTLKYAEYISRDAMITFTQKHMEYFRRKMVYELLTNQLL